MESIFNVGDVVRIRDLRELASKYGDKALPFHVASPMLDLIGRIYIVTDVLGDSYNKYDCCYKETRPLLDGCKYILQGVIDGKASKWSWSSPMLELAARIKDSLDVPTTTPSDEKKLELKVKNVRKVKLNFKN